MNMIVKLSIFSTFCQQYTMELYDDVTVDDMTFRKLVIINFHIVPTPNRVRQNRQINFSPQARKISNNILQTF